MNNKKENLENEKKIVMSIKKLNKMETNETNRKMIHWIEEDRKEIYQIQRKLNSIGMLSYAYQKKNVVQITRWEEKIKRGEIFQIYHTINTELNNWRDVYLCIETCYRKVRQV